MQPVMCMNNCFNKYSLLVRYKILSVSSVQLKFESRLEILYHLIRLKTKQESNKTKEHVQFRFGVQNRAKLEQIWQFDRVTDIITYG